MTFAEFQAAGQDCADLGAAVRDELLQGRRGRLYCGACWIEGRLYCGACWIEDTTDWPADAPGYGKGRWYTMIGRAEYQSDNLAEVERPLYEFAVGSQIVRTDFKVGNVVRYVSEMSAGDQSVCYEITEVNGDRGFMRVLSPALKFPPVTLWHDNELELMHADVAAYEKESRR